MGLPCGRVSLDACGGIIVTSRSVSLNVNGVPPATLNSNIAPHAPGGVHSAPLVCGASTSVRSGGIGLSRLGHPGTCGHTITGCSPNVNIGD